MIWLEKKLAQPTPSKFPKKNLVISWVIVQKKNFFSFKSLKLP